MLPGGPFKTRSHPYKVPDTSAHACLVRIEEHLAVVADELRNRLDALDVGDRDELRATH